jgi:nucleotide-binding universal stress UspA family protein
MFTHILVPTDGSELSQRALTEALALAKSSGGKVTALHVHPPYPGTPYGHFGPAENVVEQAYLDQQRTAATELCRDIEAQAKTAGIPVETRIARGSDVYRKIINTAAEEGCDLICMASHGRRGISGLLLGSETQKVLTHSTMPVLVLR